MALIPVEVQVSHLTFYFLHGYLNKITGTSLMLSLVEHAEMQISKNRVSLF